MDNLFNFPKDIKERHQYILECVSSGKYELEFTPINISDGKNTLEIYVSKDVIKINGIRINVSARLQQQIADIIGISLITSKVSDAIFDNASLILEPSTREITSSTEAMIEYSQLIDQKIAVNPTDKIICTLGKDWVLDNKATSTKAVNYGWHIKSKQNSWKGITIYPCASLMKDSKTGAYYKVIQQPSTWHNLEQDDYSQKGRYMGIPCFLNGEQTTIQYIGSTPEYAGLISYQGVIINFRQPGV